MGLAGGRSSYHRNPGLVRAFDISEMEREAVSDSDLEDKLMLEMRRKCGITYDWQYFPNRGDGKGATVLFSTNFLTWKNCVEEAVRGGVSKGFQMLSFALGMDGLEEGREGGEGSLDESGIAFFSSTFIVLYNKHPGA